VAGIESLYRMDDPKRFYVVLTREAHKADYESLHGKTFETPTLKVTVTIEHLDKERRKGVIHWLPGTVRPEMVQKLAARMTGDESASVYRIQNCTDKWVFFYRDEVYIPEYCYLMAGPRRDRCTRLRVTLTPTDRGNACVICGDPTHWAQTCPKRRGAPQTEAEEQHMQTAASPPELGQQAGPSVKSSTKSKKAANLLRLSPIKSTPTRLSTKTEKQSSQGDSRKRKISTGEEEDTPGPTADTSSGAKSGPRASPRKERPDLVFNKNNSSNDDAERSDDACRTAGSRIHGQRENPSGNAEDGPVTPATDPGGSRVADGAGKEEEMSEDDSLFSPGSCPSAGSRSSSPEKRGISYSEVVKSYKD
jgi:hypothetical protein